MNKDWPCPQPTQSPGKFPVWTDGDPGWFAAASKLAAAAVTASGISIDHVNDERFEQLSVTFRRTFDPYAFARYVRYSAISVYSDFYGTNEL